jgi:hypothetical protein
MRPVALERLSSYLFIHMNNVQIGGHVRLVSQFEYKVVLNSELKRNMNIGHKNGK